MLLACLLYSSGNHHSKGCPRHSASSTQSPIFKMSVSMTVTKVSIHTARSPHGPSRATGDTDQLESIDLISDRLDYDTYMNHCVDTIFPNNVLLKENKRLKSKKDKTTLAMIKRDLFDEDIPIKDTLCK